MRLLTGPEARKRKKKHKPLAAGRGARPTSWAKPRICHFDAELGMGMIRAMRNGMASRDFGE